MEVNNLRLCPFCDGRVYYDYQDEQNIRLYIQCGRCGIRFALPGEAHTKLKEAFNRRSAGVFVRDIKTSMNMIRAAVEEDAPGKVVAVEYKMEDDDTDGYRVFVHQLTKEEEMKMRNNPVILACEIMVGP